MATTLSISAFDYARVTTPGENYSVGIGWTSVGDLITVADVVTDIIVGETRAVIVSDSIDASDVPTVERIYCGQLDEKFPARYVSASGYNVVEGSIFNKVGVRSISASGVTQLDERIPTREFSGTVAFTAAISLSKRIPTRAIIGLAGAEQIAGLLPVRTISAEAYSGESRLSDYIPVRIVEASVSGITYATLSERIPPRIGTTSAYVDYLISLSKRIPPRLLQAEVIQEYGSTLSGRIPPRKIEVTEYEPAASLSGNRPVWLGGIATGESSGSSGVGTVSPTVSDEYILQYVRP